nr:uncharacterized protein LOC109180717 isoform X1 [Ipomoea trifida]
MGKWNRRYFPRRNYDYQYQDFHPTDFDDKFDSAFQENSVPSWEIDFCKSVGIPWNKVIYTKKYISCHDSVVKWDDSASQEAFHDAKTRYWARSNGVACDNPLPDPCKYVDDVDWNATVDPEMILDLDRDFFNPDEANVNNSEDVSGCTGSQDHKNLNNGENAWEVGHGQGNGTPEAGQGSGEWNESKISKNVGDPWEESCAKTGGSFKGTGWRGGGNDSSWGWNPGHNGPSGLNNTWNNSWNHDSRNAGCTTQNKNGSWSQNAWNDRDHPGHGSWNHDGGNVGCTRQNEWGNNKNGSWSRNAWNDKDHNGFQNRNSWIDRDHKPWNSGNHCDPRGNNALRGGGATNSWKNSGFQSNQPSYFELERSNTGRESFYGGSRKREGSSYHTSTFKSSRFQGGEQGANYTWRKVKNSEDYK